jgi:hypothetical protein
MDTLLPEDHDAITKMIGGVFEVEEIDDGGRAWVTLWWDSDDGEIDGHGIGLASSEMELLGGGITHSVAKVG